MLISIIIPVYNTPINSFDRCIQSIIFQTYHDLEIIVIDDGSDNVFSASYKETCERDSRILYRKIKNGGVSNARNLGIEIASGKYLTFVDSDDNIKDTFIEQAVICGCSNDSDMIIGLINYVEINSRRRSFPMQSIPKLLTTTDKDFIIQCMFSIEHAVGDYIVLASPCGRLYKTALSKKIKFCDKIHFWEDQLYNREFISMAEKFTLVPESWYEYIQNEYSAMHIKYSKWHEIYEWVEFCKHWIELNNKEQDSYAKIMYSKMILTFFNQVIQVGILSNLKLDDKEIKFILSNSFFKDFFMSLNRKDFYSTKRFIQFYLMKHRMIWIIYELARLKFFLQCIFGDN